MNPAGDLDLGSIADVIMAEFGANALDLPPGMRFCQATSIRTLQVGQLLVQRFFTSNSNEAWQEYPLVDERQSDWALAHGINRFVYHTFAHKPLGDEYRPGMTMGPYGVHWDRGQPGGQWVGAYHKYISRCSHMMQQGQAVADILYLTPEGAQWFLHLGRCFGKKRGNSR